MFLFLWEIFSIYKIFKRNHLVLPQKGSKCKRERERDREKVYVRESIWQKYVAYFRSLAFCVPYVEHAVAFFERFH